MAIPLPGYVDDVIEGETILPEWGDAIRDRAPQVFTTAAARDSAITSPQVGQFAVLTQGAQSGILQYVGPTLGWTQPWNMPWGLIDEATLTTSQTGIGGTATAISGLSVVVDSPAHRWVRISLRGEVQFHAGSGGVRWLAAIDDGTVARHVGGSNLADGQTEVFAGFRLENSDGTSVTYTATLQALGGTGATVDAVANSTSERWTIVAEDLGPQGAPT